MSQQKTKLNIALLRGKLATFEGKQRLENFVKKMRKKVQQDNSVDEDTKKEVHAYMNQIEKQFEDGGAETHQKIGELIDYVEENIQINR